jgi:hypothetical protein
MPSDPDLVTCTHDNLPGAEKVTSRLAYRAVWWFKGWRSDDDPTFDGTADDTAPIPTLADLDERTGFVHSWAEHGWGVFDRKIVNQDGAQAFTASVNGNYGRVGASSSTSANQRELWVHQDTLWANGEVTAVLKGPSTYISGNRPQMGIVLRYQLIDGHHVAFVVWYDIFVGDPRVLNISGWRGNGGPTLNQAAGGQYTAEVTRDLRIVAALRFQFGSWINELTCIPPHLHGLAINDSITVDCDDNTFDATAASVSNADREKASLQYTEDVTTSAVSNKVANGTVVLANNHQRYFPYVLKARLIGNTISVKAWRGRYEPEPADWQTVVTVATDADFPALPSGPGRFGVVAAHAHSSSYLEYGDIHFRRI